ncbi:MAG: hypothetical protein QOI38_890 [Sphingomonadales bacterium]|jgi:hypothetical protein|nr:hypothetical protein [Sphingomonadales bacterium]
MGFFQTGWKWCSKCNGLFHSRNPAQGRCSGGGAHVGGASPYALFMEPDGNAPFLPRIPAGPWLGQQGWRWCRKCQALYFAGNPASGACPAGGGHDGSGSGHYVIDYLGRAGYRSDGERCQNQWRWCPRCQQLVYAPVVFAGNSLPAPCAAGGNHAPSGSDYALNVAGPHHDANVARLLVIAPAAFEAALRPLIEHKNATGMPAFLITREALTAHYSGRDDPEKIKRGIVFAQGYLDTRYVLLVGDASHIPVRYRYTNMPPASPSFRDGWYTPADLYYANLYRNHDNFRRRPDLDHHWEQTSLASDGRFADWDANGDGKYNEHHWDDDARRYNPDNVDGWPDVAVGRVPAHDASEVAAYVAKVIRYETGEARPEPTAHTIFIERGLPQGLGLARDTIRLGETGWDADIVALNYGRREALPAPRLQRGTAGGTPVEDAAARSFWISYIGHGHADGWGVVELNRPLDTARVAQFSNEDNLPIVFASSCSTGQFVHCVPGDGPYRDARGATHWYRVEGTDALPTRVYDLGDRPPGSAPVREWLSRNGVRPRITPEPPHSYDFPDRRTLTFARGWLFGNARGGAIAYFGATTVHEPNWDSRLETLLISKYRLEPNPVLGDLWLLAQREYWREFYDNENCIGAPRIYLTYMTFFGDPSLRLP